MQYKLKMDGEEDNVFEDVYLLEVLEYRTGIPDASGFGKQYVLGHAGHAIAFDSKEQVLESELYKNIMEYFIELAPDRKELLILQCKDEASMDFELFYITAFLSQPQWKAYEQRRANGISLAKDNNKIRNNIKSNLIIEEDFNKKGKTGPGRDKKNVYNCNINFTQREVDVINYVYNNAHDGEDNSLESKYAAIKYIVRNFDLRTVK